MTSEPIITADWIEGPEFFKRTEEDWPKDIHWIKENTEIRIGNEGKPVHQTTKEDTTYRKNIEFYYEDFPSYTELKGDLLNLIRRCQSEKFKEELQAWNNQKSLKSRSAISGLTLYLDENGMKMLRLGGRITHATL